MKFVFRPLQTLRQGKSTVMGTRPHAPTMRPPSRSSARGRRCARCCDQSNVIWYDETGSAPIPPFSETGALKRLR